jgi:hypothetical protein
MDRRDFLKILLATPVAATYDFEHLLWVPKPMVIVPATRIPPQIWVDEWGKRFVYVDLKGIVHYQNDYRDVDKILNSIWREQK